MPVERPEFLAGLRESLALQLAIWPFGLVTGVAMAAGGIPPLEAIAISVFVFAGAAMLVAAQLLAADAPVAVVVLTTLVVNLRLVMYSASLRPYVIGLPLRWRLLISYLLVDNVYALCVARYAERPGSGGRLAYYLGVAGLVWLGWQLAVAAGTFAGARLPADWKLDFAAPLAFIALSVPLLRDRAMLAAAGCAAVTVVLARGLPLRLGLVLAAVAGIAAGLVLERRRA